MTPGSHIADQLGVTDSGRGLVILNYGDPSYLRLERPVDIDAAESIFLRILSYLAFADTISIPARYILEGHDMATAVVWAEPLLREGILQPELRADAATFEQYVRARQLGPEAMARAIRLDGLQARVRAFVYQRLSEEYKGVLASDLAPTGALRRIVRGAKRGRLASAFSAAHDSYQDSGDGTPDQFAALVHSAVPQVPVAFFMRWAMARYYTTPRKFDQKNVRELPKSAYALLEKARVPLEVDPDEMPAPVDYLYRRLSLRLPRYAIALHHRSYCEALLEVRSALPQARDVFYQIKTAAEAEQASAELQARFELELKRQLRIREPRHRDFAFVSGLVGVGAGVTADALIAPGAGYPAGLGVTVLANEAQYRRSRRKAQEERPWILAVDRLDSSARSQSGL